MTDVRSRIVRRLLETDFGDCRWEWHGQAFDVEDAAAPLGLLPVLARQALETAKALPRLRAKLSDCVVFTEAKNSLTGIAVDFRETTPENLFDAALLFILDAAHMALAMSPFPDAEGQRVVRLDLIERPIRNSPDALLAHDAIECYRSSPPDWF